jgi:hypothetical protein
MADGTLIQLFFTEANEISDNVSIWGQDGYLWREDIPYICENNPFYIQGGIMTEHSSSPVSWSNSGVLFSSFTPYSLCVTMYMRLH